MDDNTMEVLRVLIAALFGLIAFAVLIWGMVKMFTSGSLSASVELPEQPTWTYRRTWGEGDDEDWDEEDKGYEAIIVMQDAEFDELHEDNQRIRDRLAAALWENRRLKRGKPTDDPMAQQSRESEGA